MKEMQINAFDSDHDAERGPEERRSLQENIRQWNSNRLSLFEITDPDEVNTFFSNVRTTVQFYTFKLFRVEVFIGLFKSY